MDWYLTLLIAGSTAAGGFLAGVLILLLGGVGVTRQHSRALKSINDDLDALDARITRDQNRRKADASAAARNETKNVQALKDEAAAMLAAKPATPEIPIAAGFPSMFHRG